MKEAMSYKMAFLVTVLTSIFFIIYTIREIKKEIAKSIQRTNNKEYVTKCYRVGAINKHKFENLNKSR